MSVHVLPDTGCLMERHGDDAPPMQFVALPGDPVHDAWACTDETCSWFILVEKGQRDA